MRVVARHPVLLSMTVLVGAASFFVGNAYQAQMPGFASDLGHERADFAPQAWLDDPAHQNKTPLDRKIQQENNQIDNSICKGC